MKEVNNLEYLPGVERLKKLSQVSTKKDLRQLSHALFPGTHCPLFGVALTASLIDDLVVLIIGTDECAYYTKRFTMNREAAGEGRDNVYSFVMAEHDIVFGAGEKVREAILHLDRVYGPQAILIVTTCVPEITGEDFASIAISLKDSVKASLAVVRTEHFRCNNHLPGIERTLAALASIMLPQTVQANSVNILGHRHHGIERTELFAVLSARGLRINLSLPSKCSVELIRQAPQAALNIVTDFTALPLAKEMQERFGMEYVYFEKYASLERIATAYRELGQRLNLDLAEFILTSRERAEAAINGYQEVLDGKSFIYGNSPLLAFEGAAFFTSLGMKPLIISARDVYEHDDVYMAEILRHGVDPWVSMVANIAPLQKLYPVLRPGMYIGHENPYTLARLGIAHVVLDGIAFKLGFELPVAIARLAAEAVKAVAQPRPEGVRHVAL
ncbi:MAG: Nitrogenase molybdenum-iron protein alpha chain [Firmicutes bacterium]|nr:Nitrogenase molybdenum-iron protein alpha chain [Bacillota bacterium]